MRIALVSDTYTPQVNGVSTVLRRMVETLGLAGHEAVVVAPEYPDSQPGNEVSELRIPSVGFPPYPAIRLSLPATDPNRCGQVALAGAIDGNQTGASNPTMNNYRFNPAYQVDLILWRRILGTVTDAWYVKPTIRWDVYPGLALSGWLVYSQALTAASTPSATSATTGNTPMGLEADFKLDYATDDGFVAWASYGVLFPLSAFDGALDTSRAHAVRTGLAIRF